jgi:AmiR/NasT family two-component response regulator
MEPKLFGEIGPGGTPMKKILVVDDEESIRYLYKEELEEDGFVVELAKNGKEALELLRLFQPDLITLDIKMPVMDGIEAAERITQAHPIPIILLTAYSEAQLVERAAQANISAYLMKPVSEEDLLPAMTLALTRFKQFQALRQEIADLREALEARKTIERAKGILMRRLNLTEDEAFRRLQRQSQESNRKLAQVAEAIVVADQML